MTVRELIRELNKYDKDMDIIIGNLTHDIVYDFADIVKLEPFTNDFDGTDLCIYFLE